MPAEEWQKRVIEEKQELDARRERLAAFMAGDAFPKLSYREMSLLRQQQAAMSDYSEALGGRIRGWPS